MRYALLLHADAAAAARTTPERAAEELARYAELAGELTEAGVLRGGEAFLPSSEGVLVRLENGRPRTEAGRPTDPELGGFLLVECDHRQATEIAARLPVAAHGAVEVRPVLDLEPGPGPGAPGPAG